MASEYFVFNNHTLVARQSNWPAGQYQALASKPQRGGRSVVDVPIITTKKGLRAATLADFDEYRVQPPPSMKPRYVKKDEFWASGQPLTGKRGAECKDGWDE